MIDPDVAFYVAHGHSPEWAQWWLSFLREWNPRMTRDQEREIFLIGEPEATHVEQELFA